MIKIWCDGAASHHGRADAIGGWGYVIQFSNEEPLMFGGKKNGATNQQMELVAMIQALYFAQGQLDRGEGEFVLPCEPIEGYTDSAYIANCYKQEWYKAWEINGWLNSKKSLWRIKNYGNCLFHSLKCIILKLLK
jgi:ribonuclease HI